MNVPMIELSVSKVASIFNGMEFRETVNMNVLDKLINSDVLASHIDNEVKKQQFDNEKAQLLAYKAKARRGVIPVKYFISKSGFGRVCPFKSLSLCSIRREIRHTLATDRYVDIDVVNCHPAMLLQICQSNNISAPFLAEYIANRDEIITEVMGKYGVNRSQAKTLFIRLLYFGSFKNWADECMVNENEPSEFVANFTTELAKIAGFIFNANEELRTELKKVREKLYNEKGSVVSYFLQEYERRILECVYQYINEKKKIGNDCVLCFDGLMIAKDKYNDSLLAELSEIVREKTGFQLKFITKDMNEGYSQFEVEEKQQDEYTKIKAEFEKTNFKIMYPLLFVNMNELTGELRFDIRKELIDKYENKPVYPKMNNKGQSEISPFINDWVKDPEMRQYDRMDFIPYGIKCPADVYNTFDGYAIEKYIPSKSVDIQMFKDYLMALAGEDTTTFEYLYHWLANVIKTPANKSKTSIIIKSRQGCGKGTLSEFMNGILGDKYTSHTQGTSSFTSRFNGSIANKLFIAVDEMNAKDGYEHSEALKNLITEPTVEIEKKGM